MSVLRIPPKELGKIMMRNNLYIEISIKFYGTYQGFSHPKP